MFFKFLTGLFRRKAKEQDKEFEKRAEKRVTFKIKQK